MSVSDRLSARVDAASANDLLRGPPGADRRDDYTDQPAARNRRFSPRQLDELAGSLTDVDHQVLDVLSLVRMASGQQLNRLLWPPTPSGGRTARRHLQRLTDLRILARLHRRVGGVKSGSQGYTYALDTAGQHLAQRRHTATVRRPTPSDLFVDHTLAVTEVYVLLREAQAAGTAELTTFWTEPDCWRTYTGSGGRRAILKPDAFARWLTAEWELLAFFEVDRGTEHPGRVARKIEQYVRYWRTGDEQRNGDGVFPSVVWVAPDQRRADVIADVASTVDGASDLTVVLTISQLVDFINNTPREEVNP